VLVTCQYGYEALLARELERAECTVSERGHGWVLASELQATEGVPDLAFPHRLLREPREIRGDSVNSLARAILEGFLESISGERIEERWPLLWSCSPEVTGLGKRASSVEDAFAEQLRRRLARVARLGGGEVPRGVRPARGLFVHFTDFGRAFMSRETFLNGQRRMADDPAAPSRSFLKVEEAYGLIGCEPKQGELVIDLGAAPGGWSYSAAKRGARVVAIDNGPLKEGALGHPGITHVREDAFRFEPGPESRADWLFCDLVEEPHHVMRDIVGRWLQHGWCRRFVVNLKFGRVDPLEQLDELRSEGSPLARLASDVRVRHLYHDREEFTVVGRVRN
jgi:23S rRNA (cytidine2498-2'-O)-methyltransferase